MQPWTYKPGASTPPAAERPERPLPPLPSERPLPEPPRGDSPCRTASSASGSPTTPRPALLEPAGTSKPRPPVRYRRLPHDGPIEDPHPFYRYITHRGDPSLPASDPASSGAAATFASPISQLPPEVYRARSATASGMLRDLPQHEGYADAVERYFRLVNEIEKKGVEADGAVATCEKAVAVLQRTTAGVAVKAAATAGVKRAVAQYAGVSPGGGMELPEIVLDESAGKGASVGVEEDDVIPVQEAGTSTRLAVPNPALLKPTLYEPLRPAPATPPRNPAREAVDTAEPQRGRPRFRRTASDSSASVKILSPVVEEEDDSGSEERGRRLSAVPAPLMVKKTENRGKDKERAEEPPNVAAPGAIFGSCHQRSRSRGPDHARSILCRAAERLQTVVGREEDCAEALVSTMRELHDLAAEVRVMGRAKWGGSFARLEEIVRRSAEDCGRRRIQRDLVGRAARVAEDANELRAEFGKWEWP